MNQFKKGTPAMGILLGVVLTAAGALVMVIGFWKTLLLCLLFGLGYFLGTVEDKSGFIKKAANRLIPSKEAQVIDLKSEIARQQEKSGKTDGTAGMNLDHLIEQVKLQTRNTPENESAAQESETTEASEE